MADREYYRMAVPEVLEKLGTSEKGLDSRESAERLGRSGPNTLDTGKGPSRILLFISQFKDLLVLVLIAAAAISLAIGSFKDATVMLIIVVINAIVGFIQEYRVSRILESLKSLISSPAKALRDGALVEIAQEKLVPGDIIRLEAGDKVPADVRVIESYDLRTEDFALTGESMPQGKTSGAIEMESVLGDRDNMAFLGTTVTSGSATGVVTATGMETEMGKIAGMTERTSDAPTPLERELSILAKWLTIAVVGISAVLFGIALWQGFTLLTSMVYALGIAVALVPQALPAQVTVALSMTSKRLAAKNAVVKSLPSVETLGSTSVISTDKTGTLTQNEMTVTRVWFGGGHFEVTGTGYDPESGGIQDESGRPLEPHEIDSMKIMMNAATMASNAAIHQPDEDHPGWYAVGDPTEAALVTLSMKIGTHSRSEDELTPELVEFPFDSERKRMSSVRDFTDRHELAMKGSPDGVLSISKYIYRGGRKEPLTESDREEITRVYEEYSKQALRVLAIAYRELENDGREYVMEQVEKDVVFLGLAGMMDPPREGVREAISDCRQAGIRTFMITGDHAITAQAIGREIGLSEAGGDSRVVTGMELKQMDDRTLAGIMESEESLIFSRVDPEDKLRIIDLLEREGEIVAMTGDGVNDAPALKKADIGVAMGRIGTDVAKEASELVLLDDSFPTLVEAVREGRTIYRNLRKTILATLTANGAELFLVLLGLAAVVLRGWAIPILAIQILAIDLLAEIMPLTFLTYDPPPPDVMRKPPRKISDHIVNRQTSIEVTFFGLLNGFLSFANFALFMFRQGVTFTLDSADPVLYARATTISYLTLAFCQFVNILSRRDDRASILGRDFFQNRTLHFSIIGSIALILVIVQSPGLRDFLRFMPPGPVDWLYIIGAAAVYLVVFEAVKLGKRLLSRP